MDSTQLQEKEENYLIQHKDFVIPLKKKERMPLNQSQTIPKTATSQLKEYHEIPRNTIESSYEFIFKRENVDKTIKE